MYIYIYSLKSIIRGTHLTNPAKARERGDKSKQMGMKEGTSRDENRTRTKEPRTNRQGRNKDQH